MSTKYLNSDNILKKVYDPSTEGLRTTAVATFVGGSVDITISDLTDSIKVGDGSGNYIAVNVDGSINANVEVSAADGDNVAISDGVDILAINTNGSINVNLSDKIVIHRYNEITAVANSTLSTILTYIPVNTGKLSKFSVSGDNIAEYNILIDSIVFEKVRTYFGNSLNYVSETNISITAGQTLAIKVIHLRPFVGNFNARIEYTEV